MSELIERLAEKMWKATHDGRWDDPYCCDEEIKAIYRGDAEVALAFLIEECAKVAEAQALQFLSPGYAANQPFGSMCERFACEGLGNWFRDAITLAGLPMDAQPHGLRKAAAWPRPAHQRTKS